MKLSERELEEINPRMQPMGFEAASAFQDELPEWAISDDLEREYQFRDFREAMVFVNKVADLANDADHHPEIEIKYNRVEIELVTHLIGGLSINDFIMAAKIDEIYEAMK